MVRSLWAKQVVACGGYEVERTTNHYAVVFIGHREGPGNGFFDADGNDGVGAD